MSQTIQCCPKCGFPFVHCTCKPVTLDDIKRDLPHDDGCTLASEPSYDPYVLDGRIEGYTFSNADAACNCTRRDKIALLERYDLNRMAARVVAMCKKRGWSMHWTARGAYLHLESSKLIEAIRGKHGDPKDESGDVLLVLMSITEFHGIPFTETVDAALSKLEQLESAPPYKGEERMKAAEEAK